MIRTNEFRSGQGQLEFSVSTLEGKLLVPVAQSRVPRAVAAERPLLPFELNISGTQLLVGLTLGFGGVALFVWAVLKLITNA
jgi:hypothetical protein